MKRKNFKKTLEDRVNDIAAYPARKLGDRTIPGMIRREIALTVSQMKRLKKLHDQQFRKLLRIECSIDTELMQLHQQQPRNLPWQPAPEAARLKQQLFDIEKERRKLHFQLEDKTQSLEEKLLNLINRHDQIDL